MFEAPLKGLKCMKLARYYSRVEKLRHREPEWPDCAHFNSQHFRRLRWEDQEFKASLSYLKPCFNKWWAQAF